MELRVFDSFYSNPDVVRNYALSLDFKNQENYPGYRTDVLCQTDFDNAIKTLGDTLGRGINPGTFHTSFQYTTEEDESWVHSDRSEWAGVLYLTPNAPVDSGTTILRHKESGDYHWYDGCKSDHNYDGSEHDLSKWDPIVTVGNVYNRLVIYSGKYYHRSNVPGFGHDKHTGRLFQVFFFD